MTSWPHPDVALFRIPIPPTPFERAMRKRPAAPVPPPAAVERAMFPPPGVPILWCRCGSAIAIDHHAPSRSSLEREFRDNWIATHSPPIHHVTRDDYRAACLPHIGGCRNCGALPPRPLRFYCSAACRTAFERDHFWGTASMAAARRQEVFDRETHARIGVVCARCGEVARSVEINHRVPLNGDRPFFGCQHHLDGLEALDHTARWSPPDPNRDTALVTRQLRWASVAAPPRPRALLVMDGGSYKAGLRRDESRPDAG